MAQDTEQNFGDDEEKERAGWPLPLVAMLIAAAAAGGGYWLTTSTTPLVQTTKIETPAEAPAPQAPVVAPAEAPAKPAETQAAASASVVVAKTEEPAKPVVAAAPEAKPAEPAAAPAEVVAAPVPAVEEPKVAAAQPAAETPKATEVPPKTEDTQVAVAAPQPKTEEPKVEVPKAEAPKAAEPIVEPPKAVTVAPAEAPSFDTVRVEPNGDAVIAGRAAPGAEVIIKLGGALIGKATADDNGSFAFVSEKPLPAGAAALSLETQLNGQTVTSEQTVAVAVKGDNKSEPMVAVLNPDEPTKVIQAPKAAETTEPVKSIKLDAVDYDAQGNIIFTGRGRPNSVVRLYVDNNSAGEVKSDGDGRWMFAGTSAVVAGTHMLRADEIGPDGKVSSRVELPFLREEPAKVAAVQPAAPVAAEVKPADAPAASEEATAVVPETNAPAATAEPAAVPDAAPATVAAAPQPEPSRMVIQPGNNLWKLSRRVYGKGIRYTVIYEANKDQIRDPDLIYPGQVFVMPTAKP